MGNDFTAAQAQDLARHFLGGIEWIAYIDDMGVPCIIQSVNSGQYYGALSWRAAFRAAGVKLPYRPRFASIGPRVLLGADQVAVCKSANFAVRTAAALNAYEPDAKGQ